MHNKRKSLNTTRTVSVNSLARSFTHARAGCNKPGLLKPPIVDLLVLVELLPSIHNPLLAHWNPLLIFNPLQYVANSLSGLDMNRNGLGSNLDIDLAHDCVDLSVLEGMDMGCWRRLP